LSYFQEKSSGFDEKEDFKRNFKEEQRSAKRRTNGSKTEGYAAEDKKRRNLRPRVVHGWPCICAQPCIITKKLRKSIARLVLLYDRALRAERLLQICTAVHFLEILHGHASLNF